MNNSLDKFLPVGSVVLLSGGKKRVMITGYVAVGKEYQRINHIKDIKNTISMKSLKILKGN